MSTRTAGPKVRDGGSLVLLLAIVGLALTTAWIHYRLGGTLFLLNALGYVALAVAVAASFAIPIQLIRRLGWLPRLGLMGYAALTIGAWAVMGPYFELAYHAKAVEAVLIVVLGIDLYRTYGGPIELFRRARFELTTVMTARSGA